MHHYNYSLTELENQTPWEREIYLTLLTEELKRQQLERESRG